MSTSNSATTTTTDPPPELTKLTRLLRDLIDLARLVFHPPHNPIPHASTLLSLQDQLSHYFTKHSAFDFSTGESLTYVVELQTLVRMIEFALAMQHWKVEWPVFEVEEGEKKAVQKRVFVEIERVVFGRILKGRDDLEGDGRGKKGGGEEMEKKEEEKEIGGSGRRVRRRVVMEK